MVIARRTSHKRTPRKSASKRKRKQGKKPAHAPSAITRNMLVSEVLMLCPTAESVLAAYGIHCAGCSYGGMETMEEGVRLHGFDEGELEELLDDLTALLRRQPERPETLTVTAAAAKELKKIAKLEERVGEALLVTLDEHGAFCLEFRKEPAAGERTFTNREEPETRVIASLPTLRRIGGSTIDFREGRFKLDLPENR